MLCRISHQTARRRDHPIPEEEVNAHLDNLKEVRRIRDNKKVKECLENLRKVADLETEKGGKNGREKSQASDGEGWYGWP